MEVLKRQCDHEARRGARRMALGGFGMLVVYWGLLRGLPFGTTAGEVIFIGVLSVAELECRANMHIYVMKGCYGTHHLSIGSVNCYMWLSLVRSAFHF